MRWAARAIACVLGVGALCNADDIDCRNPVARGADLTDGDGKALVVRPAITQPPNPYYVDVTSPDAVETLLFWYFPLSQPTVAIPVPVLPAYAVAGSAVPVGVDVDLDAGQLLLVAADCRGGTAPGVQAAFVPPDAGPRVYYFANKNVSPTATATDPEGTAVAYNLTTVPPVLTMNAAAPGDAGAYGEMAFVTRPGVLTEVYAIPTK